MVQKTTKVFPQAVGTLCNWCDRNVNKTMCSVHKADRKLGSERFFLITLWESYPVILCCDVSLTGGSRCGILGSITDRMSF